MSDPLGIAGAAQAAVVAQQQARQARDDQKENSTRDARNSFTFTSTGVGSLKVAVPILFDCAFLDEPHLGSGVAFAIGPDETYYELPMCTVGVYRWVKAPQQPDPNVAAGAIPVLGASYNGATVANPEDTVPMFYTGAYLYLRVSCDLKHKVAPLIAEQHPASPVLHHHISFFGTAMKILADPIVASAADNDVVPRGTQLTGGSGS